MSARRWMGLALVFASLSASAGAAPPLDDFLRDGRYRDGLAAYAQPTDNAERFSLAVLQALDGFQRFSAGLGGLGLHPDLARSGIPFFRAAAAAPAPETAAPATPDTVAGLFRDLQTSLRQANATLAAMDDESFGVTVNASRARMDVDGDGTVASNEMLMASMGRVLGLPMPAPGADDLLLRFDLADAAWLQGYTHFLCGLLDVLAAYDWMPVWNQCAHVVFRDPQPVPPIAAQTIEGRRREMTQILDVVAALHEMRLDILRPDALRGARDDFRAMVACSRTCWRRVQEETDNDHEWLPAPAQTGPGGARVTAEQIEGWHRVLDELDAVLSGQKLLAHWRLKPGTGINLDKLVNAPPRLDLVLLVQGSALLPYVEEGPASNQATWRTLMQPFGPGFARFALWSN